MKFLVVDDHALIREALRGVLVELQGDAVTLTSWPRRRSDKAGLRVRIRTLGQVRSMQGTFHRMRIGGSALRRLAGRTDAEPSDGRSYACEIQSCSAPAEQDRLCNAKSDASRPCRMGPPHRKHNGNALAPHCPAGRRPANDLEQVFVNRSQHRACHFYAFGRA